MSSADEPLVRGAASTATMVALAALAVSAVSRPMAARADPEIYLGGVSAWDSIDCLGPWLEGSNPGDADRYGRLRMLKTPGSPMTVGRPILQGAGLDKATLRRIVNHGTGDLKRCYEREQLYAPKLAASIVVRFVITPSGSVQSATGNGTDKKVAKCAADVIGRLLFPKPANAGVVEVIIPIDFSPGRQ